MMMVVVMVLLELMMMVVMASSVRCSDWGRLNPGSGKQEHGCDRGEQESFEHDHLPPVRVNETVTH